jgi:hypothetical protein
LLSEGHHLGQRLPIQGFQGADVPVGDDHQVPAVVGVQVEGDITPLAARQDMFLHVVFGLRLAAENTVVVFGMFAF